MVVKQWDAVRRQESNMTEGGKYLGQREERHENCISIIREQIYIYIYMPCCVDLLHHNWICPFSPKNMNQWRDYVTQWFTSFYFMWACWVQDGTSNPLIVVQYFYVSPINVFQPFMQTIDLPPTGAAVVLHLFPLWDTGSVFLFLIETGEQMDGITLPINKVESPLLSGEKGCCSYKHYNSPGLQSPSWKVPQRHCGAIKTALTCCSYIQ